MGTLSEGREERNHHERETVLFSSAVRALSSYGFSNLDFDIGGKKARRRHVSAQAPGGEHIVIWIKSSTHWRDTAEAVRFPWKKLSVSPDGQSAVAVACDSAAERGATHLLAVAGDDRTGALSFARLYPIARVPLLVAEQAALTDSVFYRAHSAALIVCAYSPDSARRWTLQSALAKTSYRQPSAGKPRKKVERLIARARVQSIAVTPRYARRFLKSPTGIANAAVSKVSSPRLANGILKPIMSWASQNVGQTRWTTLSPCAPRAIGRLISLPTASK